MINVRMQHKDTVKRLTPKITVIGVGGAGGNAVNNMISAGLQGCEFVVCNSDAQALEGSLSDVKLQLGATVTGGLGAGAKPEIGRAAAEESLDDVMQYLEGANMAFITAGMGGGTGTGAAPVIARACREKGILTVGVVTKPFHFEGTLRMRMAEEGIREMQEYVDTLIVIPNQNLFRIANEKTTFAEAFRMADSVLQSGVRGVTDLMVMPGLINLDFADIRSAMLEMGKAMMGTGEAMGERRAIEAAESAINNPLLDDVSMKGARGVIINVTGGMDMTLFEVDEACNRIRDEVDPNANIIFGSTFDEQLEGIMRVSVVATGIDAGEQKGKLYSRGPSIINAITGQERKLERALPNTAETAQAQAETIASAPIASATVIPAYVPMSTLRVSTPVVPSSISMRAPGVVESRREEVARPVYEQADASVVQSSGGEWVAPKGSVYQNSYIPPKPVDNGMPGYTQPVYHQQQAVPAAAAAAVATAPAAAPQTQEQLFSAPGLTASRQHAEQPVQTMVSPGLNLKPPVPGANTAQKKRTPSLFERFTNSPLWNHGATEEKAEDAVVKTEEPRSGSATSTGGFAPSLRAPTRPVQQGSLNIEAQQVSEGTEDELDIPAFLRRQAN